MQKSHINKTTYFEGISEAVFGFLIGGYQPLDKYLKARKDRELTLNDIETIKKTATAIQQTLESINKIPNIV